MVGSVAATEKQCRGLCECNVCSLVEKARCRERAGGGGFLSTMHTIHLAGSVRVGVCYNWGSCRLGKGKARWIQLPESRSGFV